MIVKKIVCGIYKIISPTGHIYIGQSVDIYKRFAAYKHLQCKTQPRLLTSFKGHGVDSHKFEIIHICEEKELNDLEKYYVELYNCFNTPHGLNLISGGGSYGKRSEETKKKNSEANKGEKHPQFGCKQSIEVVRNRSEKNRGQKRTDEQKKRIDAANRHRGNKYCLGRKHTEETKIKMSIAVTGRKYSEERKQKMSEMAKGKPIPPAFSFKGKSHSEQSKHQLSQKRIGDKNPMYGKGLKLILNTETGIFYEGLQSVSEVCGVNKITLSAKLRGYTQNNTSFVYI
jgi:hypothetical protein